MTAKLATAPASAVGTPGRRRISRSGAGASVCCASVAYAFESSFVSCLIPSETSRPSNEKSDDPSRGRAGQEEDGRAESEDALDAGDGDDRHRPERDGELDHPGQADESCREQERIAACGRHESSSSRPLRKTAAPPCAGCRTYVPPN